MPAPPSNFSKSEPVSHFFIQPGGFTQGTDKAFGPVQGNEANEFRLTAKFTCNAAVSAYAICKGIVLIQPQNGSTNKVNLVLRPYSQPYPGLNIKYFVYRGLRKSDFFTTAASPQIIPTVANVTSDFINKINADFDAFYSQPLYDQNGTLIPKPAFIAKYIGYDPAVANSALLSDIFFKESVITGSGSTAQESSPYELPLIDEGKLLGNFETGDGGIDVVLDYGDYKNDFDNSDFIFDLNYARASEYKLVLSGTDTEKKLKREQSSQFIDAAAFFGLFVRSGKVKVHNGATVTDKSGAAIYTDVLSPFITKNNWYIYIQGDRTRSYDYYNYYAITGGSTNNLKTGVNTTLSPVRYGNNGWPVLINTQQQSPVAAFNNLYLQLVTDNNHDAVLYARTGVIEDAQQNNFCNADNLRSTPDASGNFGNLTRTIKLNNPAAADGKNIAGLAILLYKGMSYVYLAGQTTNQNNQPVSILAQPNFFDDVFDLIKSSPVVKSSSTAVSKMNSSRLQLINHYYDNKQQGISAVQTLTVTDNIDTADPNNPTLDRVLYITETVDIMNNPVSVTGVITSDTKTSSGSGKPVTQSKSYRLSDPYYYELQFFSEAEASIKGLLLKTIDASTPAKIILGITKAENDLLKALIITDRRNPRLFLIDLFEDGKEFLSTENISYQKYKLGVVTEQGDRLELRMPATDIVVYSLDRKYHFSEMFSRYMPEEKTIIETQHINTAE